MELERCSDAGVPCVKVPSFELSVASRRRGPLHEQFAHPPPRETQGLQTMILTTLLLHTPTPLDPFLQARGEFGRLRIDCIVPRRVSVDTRLSTAASVDDAISLFRLKRRNHEILHYRNNACGLLLSLTGTA
jgi:hypothetical protein